MQVVLNALYMPKIWLILTALFAVLYMARMKRILPQQFCIGAIFKEYRKVFIHPLDCAYPMVISATLAVATAFTTPLPDWLSCKICMIASILLAGEFVMLCLIAQEAKKTENKPTHNLSDKRLMVRSTEATAVGALEFILAIGLWFLALMKLLLQPYSVAQTVLDITIYFASYFFIWNAILLARRLAQVTLTR